MFYSLAVVSYDIEFSLLAVSSDFQTASKTSSTYKNLHMHHCRPSKLLVLVFRTVR